jgi:hypothetical protein
MTKKYDFTRKFCKSRIQGVCSRCGGELVPIKTENNIGQPTYWAGCTKCHVFNWGIPQRIYNIALILVDKHNFHPSSYANREYEKDDPEWHNLQMNETTGIIYIVVKAIKEYEMTNYHKCLPPNRKVEMVSDERWGEKCHS